MLHTRKDQCFIAELLIGFVLPCSHKKGIGTSLMSGFQRRNNISRLSADTDSDHQTALIQNHRIYFHNVAVRNRLNIQPNAHKTQLHFLRDKSGTASSIDIHPWSGHKQFGDTRNLCFVQKRIRLIQKFLISIKLRNFEVRNILLCFRSKALLIFINKLPISVKTTFLGKTGKRSLRYIKDSRNMSGGKVFFLCIVHKEICDRSFQWCKCMVIRFN